MRRTFWVSCALVLTLAAWTAFLFLARPAASATPEEASECLTVEAMIERIVIRNDVMPEFIFAGQDAVDFVNRTTKFPVAWANKITEAVGYLAPDGGITVLLFEGHCYGGINGHIASPA